jgi:hypothetical protein
VDLNGKILHQETVSVGTTSVRIDVSEWAKGVYLVNLESAGKKSVKKLLVN